MCSIARVALLVLQFCFVQAVIATSAPAQSWPQRPVRLIVPVGTGTAIDFAARLYAERLGEIWKQPVVIENRPGGDGITGVAAFTGMNDDHTLLFAHSSPAGVLPVIHEKLPYDAARDLVPISMASDIFIVIAATESLEARSIRDLIAASRKQPAQLNWAAGPGLPRYVFDSFLKSAGLSMNLVSYREVPPLLQDFREGRLHAVAHSLAAVTPVVQSGKARLLAIANSQRSSIAPDVPTAVEAGYPTLAMDGFCGFYGRRGIADELRDKIARDVRTVAADPKLVERLVGTGQVARASTPAEFAAALAALRQRIAKIANTVSKEVAP
jgi:tripartite-type tricarboxylate transporter receptor subunit TctC